MKLAKEAPTSDFEKLAALLKQQEVRAHVRSLDPLQLDVFYREAVRSGNDLAAEAIESAPIPFRFADEDLITKSKSARLARRFPEEAAALDNLRLVERTLKSALATARNMLRENHRLPLPRGSADPIAELAGGKKVA